MQQTRPRGRFGPSLRQPLALGLMLAFSLLACAPGLQPLTGTLRSARVDMPERYDVDASGAPESLDGQPVLQDLAAGDFGIQSLTEPLRAAGYIVQLAPGVNFYRAIAAARATGARIRRGFPKLGAFSVERGDPVRLAALPGVLSVEPNLIIEKHQSDGSPSPEPTPSATPEPTSSPTPEPTQAPTPEPTQEPTLAPISEPSPTPTSEPTTGPTTGPGPEPTAQPSAEATSEPEPTAEPSPLPTPTPTAPLPPQIVPAGIARIGAAPGQLSPRGAGIGIAILDTGVSPHRDLRLGERCFSIDGDCGDQTRSPGHGTHVAGIAAALDNGTDVVGVAPEATIYPVDVFGRSDYTSDDNIVAGLNWIASDGPGLNPPIRVVNMSLGRPGKLKDNSSLRVAIQALYRAGVTVVVSAGNSVSKTVSQTIPAAYPEVLAVASSTALDGPVQRCGRKSYQVKADTASFFTSDGKFSKGSGVTISAPGASLEIVDARCADHLTDGILSTLPDNLLGKYSGTSMAAPHVSGVVALLYQQRPGLTPELARSALRKGALLQRRAPINSRVRGFSYDGEREGILSAPGALSALNGLSNPLLLR